MLFTMHIILNKIDNIIIYFTLFCLLVNNSSVVISIRNPRSTTKGEINSGFFTVTALIIKLFIKLETTKNVSSRYSFFILFITTFIFFLFLIHIT